uniref:Galactose-1-phosphate uridyl transferase N-terminal domain-containing protein n=1 Tax=Accipiter nisus TaxID=211598 RepID=A0A8B9NXI8_9AVES
PPRTGTGRKGSASRVPPSLMPRSSLPTEQHQHARYNLLRDGWVLVLAHWVPPGTQGTFVFPVLQPDQGHMGKVMCFHPRLDLTLPLVFPAEIWAAINTWAELLAKLGASYPWVQIFENKGVMMGCSNPYPHCQVSSFILNEVRLEDQTQQQHLSQHSMPMLLEYAEQEACWKVSTWLSSLPWELDVCWGGPPSPQKQSPWGVGAVCVPIEHSVPQEWLGVENVDWLCHTGPPDPSRSCCCPAATSAASRTSVSGSTPCQPLSHVLWAQPSLGGSSAAASLVPESPCPPGVQGCLGLAWGGWAPLLCQGRSCVSRCRLYWWGDCHPFWGDEACGAPYFWGAG